MADTFLSLREAGSFSAPPYNNREDMRESSGLQRVRDASHL